MFHVPLVSGIRMGSTEKDVMYCRPTVPPITCSPSRIRSWFNGTSVESPSG